ncbi:response regulator [Paracoccus gahaiensis]|uniref:Response regulator n=2 Tax=Paracoccus gahaiensis TaxID=1706839 RepID=A0A4U0RAH8_9RHOB|nr:response regulator [Paracoccus gahaiensis]
MKGRHVLVVEDELLILLEIEDTLSNLGAEVVGPASHVDAALHLATEASLDAAILDVNIKGGNTFAVADVLAERGIPFVFCTGYSAWVIEERHRDRPRLTKPYTAKELERQVLHLLPGLSR